MLPDPWYSRYDIAGASETTKPFSIVSFPTSTSSLRVNKTAGLGEPRLCTIAHQVVGKGDKIRDRHQLKFEADTVVGGVADPNFRATLSIVLDAPRVGFSAAQRTQLARQIIGAFRGVSGDALNEIAVGEFVDKWAAGES